MFWVMFNEENSEYFPHFKWHQMAFDATKCLGWWTIKPILYLWVGNKVQYDIYSLLQFIRTQFSLNNLNYIDKRSLWMGPWRQCPITFLLHLLQIEQKLVAMSLISSAISQRILMKSGRDYLLGSESNLAKSKFENSKRLPWKIGKTF